MTAPSSVRTALGAVRRAKSSIPATTISASNVAVQGRRHRSHVLEKLVTSEGIDIEEIAKERGIQLPSTKPQYDAATQSQIDSLHQPQNVSAIHLAPLRRSPTHGIPVCDLQLRTYSMRNMDVFADFALRAAYYLNLPAKGPIPLPRITERWTVPRSNFIFKKSQENYERITMRRLIQIQDGHPETVRLWLGVLMKHQYHGVGMKANVWEHDSLDSATALEKELENAEVRKELDKLWENYGMRADLADEEPAASAIRNPQYTGHVVDHHRAIERERGDVVARLEEKAKQEEEAFKFLRAKAPSTDATTEPAKQPTKSSASKKSNRTTKAPAAESAKTTEVEATKSSSQAEATTVPTTADTSPSNNAPTLKKDDDSDDLSALTAAIAQSAKEAGINAADAVPEDVSETDTTPAIEAAQTPNAVAEKKQTKVSPSENSASATVLTATADKETKSTQLEGAKSNSETSKKPTSS